MYSFSFHLDDKVTSDSNIWATFYSSTSLAAPVATRLAASIDFSGSSLSSQPVSSLVSGVGWSVRWSGFVRAPVAGGATWTFFIGLAQGGNGGDGVRGWVDGVAVVDGWGGIAGSEVSGTVVLSGASNSYYEVVVEYKAVGAAYGCTLSWSEVSVPKQLANRLVSGGRFSFTEYQFRSWSLQGLYFNVFDIFHEIKCFVFIILFQMKFVRRPPKCFMRLFHLLQTVVCTTRFQYLAVILGVM